MAEVVKRMTREHRDDMRRQVYSANIRGMRIPEIAKAFDISDKVAKDLLREARDERIRDFREYEKDDEDGSLTFLLDHIQTLRNKMFMTLRTLEKGGSKSNNISGMYNGLIHLVELEAKIKGILTNRVTGGDGHGPVEMVVTDRNAMMAQLQEIFQQQSQLNAEKPKLYLTDEDDE